MRTTQYNTTHHLLKESCSLTSFSLMKNIAARSTLPTTGRGCAVAAKEVISRVACSWVQRELYSWATSRRNMSVRRGEKKKVEKEVKERNKVKLCHTMLWNEPNYTQQIVIQFVISQLLWSVDHTSCHQNTTYSLSFTQTQPNITHPGRRSFCCPGESAPSLRGRWPFCRSRGWSGLTPARAAQSQCLTREGERN